MSKSVHHIVQVSSQFQILALCAAIQHGAVPIDKHSSTLLVCNNTPIPEIHPFVLSDEVQQLADLYFGKVVLFNDLTYPLRPKDFSPSPSQRHIWQRLLRDYFAVPHDSRVHLTVESLQVNPARALAMIFGDSPLSIHADGLMVYSPTRFHLDPTLTQRIHSLVYPDFLPGISPLLFNELAITRTPVPLAACDSTIRSLSTSGSSSLPVRSSPTSSYALILGQYLSQLGVLTQSEEDDLYRGMLDRAVTQGFSAVVFRPHPSAPPTSVRSFVHYAHLVGVDITVDDCPTPVEFRYILNPPEKVFSVFSTALATASIGGGLPVEAVGTELLLEALTPYQNSNRVPVTLCDVLFRADAPSLSVEEVQELVNAVGYCMQARTLPHLRDDAQRFVDTHRLGSSLPWRRYIKKRRAESLGLISPPKPQPVVEAGPRPPASLYGRVRRAVGRRVRAQVRGNQ